MCTPIGERIAVRVGCRFRRPTHQQTAVLAPVWRAALMRCGMSGEDLDLYVQRSREPNAYAVSRRSVAVTSGAVEEFRACRMGHEYLEAILCHELGHHRTKSTKYLLTVTWLGAPWRFAARLFTGVGLATIGRRQPIHLLAVVVLAVVVVAAVLVAVVQAVQQGDVATALTLSSVAMCAIVCPLADAAVSRRSEYAADRYAAACGAGPQLASALLSINPGTSSSKVSWTRRVVSGHPSVDRRLEALDAIVIRPHAHPPEVWGSASAWHDTATAARDITMSTHPVPHRSGPGRIDPLPPAPVTMRLTIRPGYPEEERAK